MQAQFMLMDIIIMGRLGGGGVKEGTFVSRVLTMIGSSVLLLMLLPHLALLPLHCGIEISQW